MDLFANEYISKIIFALPDEKELYFSELEDEIGKQYHTQIRYTLIELEKEGFIKRWTGKGKSQRKYAKLTEKGKELKTELLKIKGKYNL